MREKGLAVCGDFALHTNRSATQILQISVPASRSSLKTVHRTVFLTLRPSRVQVPQNFYIKTTETRAGRISVVLVQRMGLDGLCPSFVAFHSRTPDCVRLRRGWVQVPTCFMTTKNRRTHSCVNFGFGAGKGTCRLRRLRLAY